MLIVGAGDCALDIIAMLELEDKDKNLCFYDDISKNTPNTLYNQYPILKNSEAARKYLLTKDRRYILGIGAPKFRYVLSQKFDALGGELISWISEKSQIAKHASISERGVIIMHGNILTNEVKIGEGSLINMRCTLGHYCNIGRFCNLAPGVFASSSNIGDFSYLGINTIIKPKVNVGRNVTVGAGSVIVKDVPNNWIVAGNPAAKIGENKPIES